MKNGSYDTRKPNPRQKANFISTATFFYVIPTFIQGYKKEFEISDLYETLHDYRSSTLGNKVEVLWEKELKKASKIEREPSLRTVIIQAFGLEYLLFGLMLAVIELVIKPAQALLLGRLILFYMPHYSEDLKITEYEAYLCTAGIVLLSLLIQLIIYPYVLTVQLIGLKVKIACCSLIYRKALKLNNAAFEKTNVGQMVNLLSDDIITFPRCSMMMNYLWVGPLQCVVVTWLMYREVGISSIFGSLLLLLFVSFYFYLGKLSSQYRLKAALRTDERVRFMNEIILGIQVIKMYAWEKPISRLLVVYRKHEMKYIRISSYIKAMYLTFDVLIIPIIMYVAILAFVIFGNVISADKVFILTVLYNTLRLSMAKFVPQGIGLLAESMVSINRMNKFLLNPEVEIQSINECNSNNAIEIEKCFAKWPTSKENTLTNVSFSVKRGSLIAVIGSVGSGKTSLLNLILNELSSHEGDVKVNGKVSYASQKPWLFGSTIRQNILFGEEVDVKRYNNVVRNCSLERDFSLLPYGDNTIVGGRGASLSGGQKARINLARAVYRDADIYLLDDPLSAVDGHVGNEIFHNCIATLLRDKTVILVTHQRQYLAHVDRVIVLENGVIKTEGESGELDVASLFKNQVESEDNVELRNSKTQEIVQEQKSKGTVSKNTYRAYAAAGGNFFIAFIVPTLFLLSQLLTSGGSYFLTYWVNMEQRVQTFLEEKKLATYNRTNVSATFKYAKDQYYDLSTETCIYVYSIITFACIVITFSRSFVFCNFSMRSSEKLHNSMFNSVIHATMRFFNTDSAGRILNRFASDMGTVDNLLPYVAIDTLQIMLLVLASVILIAIVDYFLLIPAIVIGIILYLLKLYCLSTNRNIKRLEGITRSPVIEHLSSSMEGLSTIRAFHAEKVLQKEFDTHQDLHSSCYHLFITTSQGFGYFVDFLCTIYVSVVTLSFTVFGNETFGGNVGLAITQCLASMGALQWGIRLTAELENHMTSVERILEYNSIEHETSFNKKSEKNWPEHGEISFVKLGVQYAPQDPLVLKNLNFTIKPGEKIGIVGRTGAGKSSIVNALFRLCDISGNILIDKTDIATLDLRDLRSKISIIPQEPVLFSGSVRMNLDPFEEFNDDALWTVLEEVQLKELVMGFTLGLCSIISQGGSNLSVGQRQLVCLARAILRNNKILVLDEATANVDPETDDLIQKTIRKKFENCTVLTIAHRLNTIMDSDRVMVMSAGEILEFDHPDILLLNHEGYFYDMVQKSGKTNFQLLN